jgi:hypothetical protein
VRPFAFKGIPSLALPRGPLTEFVAIGDVRLRDSGITVALDIVRELPETFLPTVGAGSPGPAGQRLELAHAIVVKSAFGVPVALRDDPHTEPLAVDRVELWHPRVPVLFDVAQKVVEILLPLFGNQPRLSALPSRSCTAFVGCCGENLGGHKQVSGDHL